MTEHRTRPFSSSQRLPELETPPVMHNPNEAGALLAEFIQQHPRLMILTGAGGTGKTTVLNVVEAFCDYFLGSESVRKAAPTNTAARLLRGDTLHALYKLPKSSLQGSRGQLSSRVLKRHQKRWNSARAHFIDEISVVPPAHLMQAEVRVRSAKQRSHIVMGGLGTVLSGDFLQLPPVDRPSFAVPLDEVGKIAAVDEDEMVADDAKKALDKHAESEHRGGHELWRRFHTVVSLSLNMRSSGMLARILAEMRSGELSDEAWEALQGRVLGTYRCRGKVCALPPHTPDSRLLEPPFSDHFVQYVVHRHFLRVSQAYQNAVVEAVSRKTRLYVVTAVDEVKRADSDRYTEKVRLEVLRLASLRKIKNMPAFLPLYEGMRMLLYSKVCVRLGLMNGCECEIVQIIFAEEEVIPDFAVAGEPIWLTHMPVALLLRALGASWVLPSTQLPY